MRDVYVMILAGGKGDSLGVLTRHRPASALPFGGKFRAIDFVLSNCAHSELSRVGLLTQYAPSSLNRHVGIGRPWGLDRRGGLVLLQPYGRRDAASWYRGTADALAQNRDRLQGSRLILVLSGDAVYMMDYGDMVRAHEASGAAMTMAVKEVAPAQSRRYGMVTLEGPRVTRLEEKPAVTDTRWASMGVYLFNTPTLLRYLDAAAGPDLVYHLIIPMVESGQRVGAYPFEGFHEDLGTVEAYYRANLDLLSRRPPLNLYDPEWPVLTLNEELAPALFGPESRVSGSLVANGCVVEGEVVESVLFGGARVEPGARVERSILFSNVRVEAGARITRTILDKNVRVGAGAEVGGEAAITVAGKNAVLPAGVRVGEGARVDL
ncbi:MAG TPA: sugar phosphate nucleotidyltransferase, partial [Candidatus Saccharimonadales bacterium]|nr:sugar phosphate nucleotidyltransferase [Candidatus Saccharimonadales bacterium]